MTDYNQERLRLAAARADFLDGADAAGVPDIVAASWRRSRSAGVAHDAYEVMYHRDIDPDSRLARCARPVLERLTVDMSDVPVSIALADSGARIIDRRDCSSAVGRVLDRVDFNPGFSFEEDGVGTNGIGTAFEAGQAVSVVGAAHFNESLTPFACTGAPVLDPLTGRLEGVLDVSLLAEMWSPLIHAMVRTAASDIGRNLMLDRNRALQALFDTYLRAETRSRHAVMAVGDTVILNHRAQRLLDPEEQMILQHHARYLFGRPHASSDEVSLPDGRTLYLRVLRVRAGDDTSGVVLLVSEQPHDAIASPMSAHSVELAHRDDLLPHTVGRIEPAPLPASRTPAWSKAWAEVHDALATGRPLLLTGEPGAGRLDMLEHIFGRLFPDGSVAVVAPDSAAQHGAPSPATDPTPAMLVLRDIDRFGESAVEQALCLLRQAGPATRVAATMDGSAAAAASAELLSHLDLRVALPALRHRAADIPQLARTLLTELAPGRGLRLAPAAERLLSAYSWPGNLAQLRDALTDAVSRRHVGEIQVEDLPGYCRTASLRPLSPLQTAERDAIIAALESSGGNRLRAAAALGMSRSSLYRKLKQFRLDSL